MATTATNGCTNGETNGKESPPEIDPEVKHLVCEWISDTLQHAWLQPEAERKKAVKQLFLKWHPDKNADDPVLALEATQHIQKELERLEFGLPRPRTSQYPSQYSSYRTRDPFSSNYDDVMGNMYRKKEELRKEFEERERHQRMKQEERDREREQGRRERERQRRDEQERADDEARERREQFKREQEERRQERQKWYTNGDKEGSPGQDNEQELLRNEREKQRRAKQEKIDEEARQRREDIRRNQEERRQERMKLYGIVTTNGDSAPTADDATGETQRNGNSSSTSSSSSSSTSGTKYARKPKPAGSGISLTDEEIINGLLRQSQHDIKSAENDMGTDEPAYEWACFKAHQASEKAIKALQFLKIGLKSNSHELTTLAASVRDPDLMDLASVVQEKIGNNNKLYNMVLSDFSIIPHDDYTVEMALEAVTSAKDIIERVQILIG